VSDDMELIRGSGNVFRDFGYPDAEVRQAKALLAAEIIKVLDGRGLSTREAAAHTGVAHAEFSRIRNVRLERFTFDRLLTILDKLGQDVALSVVVTPREAGVRTAKAHHP
jgi:predicted XRE-type DNA-binding protein